MNTNLNVIGSRKARGLYLGIVNSHKNQVVSDGGTVEGLKCLNNNIKTLNPEDSAYTDYSTRVFNEMGIVEPSESETFDNTLASILAIDTPAVLLIPNGRREGKLYSALPTSGSGDFTFTGVDVDGGRTRINKAGQIEKIRRNLLNDTKTQSVNWTATANFTKTNNSIRNNACSRLICTGISNGVDYQFGLKYTNFPLVLNNGSTYTFSFRFKPLDGNGNCAYFFYTKDASNTTRQIGARFNVFTGVNASTYAEAVTKVGRSITHEGDGIYLVSETFTMTAAFDGSSALTNTLTLGFNNGANSQLQGRGGLFGTPQLEPGFFPTVYQESNNGISQPRIDFTSGNAAFLAEPQRTNLDTLSALFTGWSTQQLNISTSAASNPLNLASIGKIIPDTSLNQHRVFLTFTYSGIGVMWCYAKADGYSFLSMADSGGLNGQGIIFNLSNGTISGSASGYSGKIESVGNGWYKCVLYGIQVSTSANKFFIVRNANNTSDFAGDGTSGILICHKQFEVGLVESSAIITEGATKTRIEDSAFSPTFSGAFTMLINQTWNVQDNVEGFAHYLTGSGGLKMYFRYLHSAGLTRIYDQVNSTAYLGVYSPNKTQKVCLRFNGTTYNLFVNGVKSNNYTPAIALNITQIELGSKSLNIMGASNETIRISKYQFHNNALSDAQCIALTT